MSEEGDKKLYAHYTALIGGSIKSGNPVRDELIVSDAKKHLADLVRKRPNINFEGSPQVEPKEEVKSKSKGKK